MVLKSAAYESRFAELSRRRAGRNMHCLPRRAHLSHISCRSVRSQRILREKQFWHVLETSCEAFLAEGSLMAAAPAWRKHDIPDIV
jgi:hypothetical protein